MSERRRKYYAAIGGLSAECEQDAMDEAKSHLTRGLSGYQVTVLDGDVSRTRDGAVALLVFECELETAVDAEMTAVENGMSMIEVSNRRRTARGFLEKYQ